MKKTVEGDTVRKILGIVAELQHGNRHSRRTIAKATGRSLPTADRWIEQILAAFPEVRRVPEGKTKWIIYQLARAKPSKLATVGACVAASLGSMFEGTQHERNLKDARDHMLRERGESYTDLDRKFVFAPRGGEYALPEHAGELDEIIEALLNCKLLRFSYQHGDGRAEEGLRVKPLSLLVFQHQFYLIADQGDARQCYRFARMSAVESMDSTFSYPSKNEYDPRVMLEPSFGIHVIGTSAVEEVVVELTGFWARYSLTHRWHPSQTVTKGGDGTVSVGLRVRVCPELETWVLSLGEHARVVRPQALRSAIAERLRTAVAIYSPASGPNVAKAKRRAGQRDRRVRTR